MIPAPPGIVAQYNQQTTRKDGTVHKYMSTLPVVAFDDEGEPMVLGKHRLVHASILRGFAGISGGDQPELVAVMPANGWRVEFTEPDSGHKHSQPLLGWGLKANGDVVPLDADERGWVEQLTNVDNGWRVYHPDADPTP